MRLDKNADLDQRREMYVKSPLLNKNPIALVKDMVRNITKIKAIYLRTTVCRIGRNMRIRKGSDCRVDRLFSEIAEMLVVAARQNGTTCDFPIVR